LVFVYLSPKTVKEHRYYYVLNSLGGDNRDRKKVVLYLGRLDRLTPELRAQHERAILALRDDQLLHAFYAQLAHYGHPVPRPTLPGLTEDGPFSLPPVDFATLTDALRQDDLSSRDLAALVSRIGLPVRAEELLAAGVRVDLVKKTRSLSLFYRATSPRLPPTVRRATGNSKSRRRSDVGSARSARP
jgi:hypothetical protein